MNINNGSRLILLLIIVVLTSVSCLTPNLNRNDKPQEFVFTNKSIDFDKDRLNRIDSFLNKQIIEGVLPNAVTFVVKNGAVVHHKAYGFKNIQDGIALKKDDIFRIASQTKAIVSVALMTLYEEGQFLLDDPVSMYIPEFADMTVLDQFNPEDTTYTSTPARRQITIRHLLTHTSGIHYGILGGGVGSMMYAKEGIPAVNSLDSVTVEQVVKKIAQMPLMFEPGTKFMYGMNTDVIGYLIEVLSGKKLDAFVADNVLIPLGMKDSHFYLPENKKDRLVTLYSSSSNGSVLNTNDSYQNYPIAGARMFLSGGAGLCGTIEDYAKFCQMLLNGGEFNNRRVLSRKTVDLMTCNQIGDLSINNRGNKFGLGFEIYSKNGASSHLSSEGAYKWGGMYYTDYLIDPSEKLIFLFYTNIQPYRGINIHQTYHNLVYQSLN
ncbi:MAG: beta-lactamase family protein [Marinilabiliaceae bacterium]|nr:beta-lactamase family protein [Marinilabiliaceae bacterium]